MSYEYSILLFSDKTRRISYEKKLMKKAKLIVIKNKVN